MLKNLAGHDVSIFLYKFVLRKNAISFVINESIAEDMYPDIEKKMQPYLHACSESLLRKKHLCDNEVIMDGNILTDGCFEVMLTPGLGKHFVSTEKQNLFNDAHEIAELLIEVMDMRSKEIEDGVYPGPQAVIPKIEGTQSTNDALEALGQEKDRVFLGGNVSNLRQLRPEDLPLGVSARKGYDHRGHCYAFEHVKLGDLGKIVLIDVGAGVRIEADLQKGNSGGLLDRKEKIFKKVISIIEKALSE